MNKLDMAHDYMVAWMQSGNSEIIDANELASFFFSVADAMQAEADKREQSEAKEKREKVRALLNDKNTFLEREGQHFDDVLQPEVDWRLAPSWANYYKTDGKNSAWTSHDFDPVGDEVEQTYSIGFLRNDAPSFGFTESHVMERPHD